MAYGVEKSASSASCHPFLRSTGLSNPLRYACTRSRVSDRAKQGPMRSQMLLNRLVHTSSGDKNDEGASTFIGSLLPFLFFLLSYHTYHCSTRACTVRAINMRCVLPLRSFAVFNSSVFTSSVSSMLVPPHVLF